MPLYNFPFNFTSLGFVRYDFRDLGGRSLETEHLKAWIPIASGEFEINARASIRDITNELQRMETSSFDASNFCEQALLYAYLGLDAPLECWNEKSLDCLNLAIDDVAAGFPLRKSLYGGLAGIGWMIQHAFSILSGDRGGVPTDGMEDDALSAIDAHLLDSLAVENSSGCEYDLIGGYVGIGVYWLERLPRKSAMLGIRQIVEALERIAEKTSEGIAWFTTPSMVPQRQPEAPVLGYYNLGVAHGVPGVIALLAQIATARLEKGLTDKACMLLTGAMEWLLAQQRPPQAVSRYSSWISVGQPSPDSRIAWCYGDLGIAGVLWFVAQRTKNLKWMWEARSLTDQCLPRQSEIVDSALCHGALGIAHIYNRIYHYTQDDLYRRAALDWSSRGMALREDGVGIGGYYYWTPGPHSEKSRDPSFLTGAIGIALALLSLIAPIEPRWDRRMLLSGLQLPASLA
jgi:lantibiotic biosynthesis protein